MSASGRKESFRRFGLKSGSECPFSTQSGRSIIVNFCDDSPLNLSLFSRIVYILEVANILVIFVNYLIINILFDISIFGVKIALERVGVLTILMSCMLGVRN